MWYNTSSIGAVDIAESRAYSAVATIEVDTSHFTDQEDIDCMQVSLNFLEETVAGLAEASRKYRDSAGPVAR